MILDASSVICERMSMNTMEFLFPEVNQDIRYIRLNQPGVEPSCARWRLGVLLVGHLGEVDTFDMSMIDVFA